MTINRWAARSDSNRAEIAEVFRAHGWVVYDLRTPVDLLVGKGGVTMLVECKRDAKAKHTKAQASFLATWIGGPVLTIRSAEDAKTAARMV